MRLPPGALASPIQTARTTAQITLASQQREACLAQVERAGRVHDASTPAPERVVAEPIEDARARERTGDGRDQDAEQQRRRELARHPERREVHELERVR